MKKLNRVVGDALERAAVTETGLSIEAGYDRTSFARFKAGRRNATPRAARALAEVLRRRAKLLNGLADRLDAEAEAVEERDN